MKILKLPIFKVKQNTDLYRLLISTIHFSSLSEDIAYSNQVLSALEPMMNEPVEPQRLSSLKYGTNVFLGTSTDIKGKVHKVIVNKALLDNCESVSMKEYLDELEESEK